MEAAKREAEDAVEAEAAAALIVAGSTASGTDVVRMQKEREMVLKQRLIESVSSPSFSGKSTTDFYGFGKVLGQGSFGKVRLAWHRLAGTQVAIKSYEKSKMTEEHHWKRVKQEIKLMERLNHPHVIRMLEMIDSPKRIHIVMEHAGGGNLCSYVKARRRLPEHEARKIFIQLLLGVEYMHDLGIIHRDIKLENVLFDEDRNMKLVDFGFSVACRDPNKRLKIFCGTPSYMAPEIVLRQEYLGRPVDVWSLGVLLYACLCGCFPFVAKSYPELYKKIAAAHLRLPDHLSHSSRDLLRRMLHPDPTKRLTLARVRRHPWVKPVAAAAINAVSVPKDTGLQIADDPADDVLDAALRKVEEVGLPRDGVVSDVLSRAKSCRTTTYYLLLAKHGRAALKAAVPAAKLEASISQPSTATLASNPRPASALPRERTPSEGYLRGGKLEGEQPRTSSRPRTASLPQRYGERQRADFAHIAAWYREKGQPASPAHAHVSGPGVRTLRPASAKTAPQSSKHSFLHRVQAAAQYKR